MDKLSSIADASQMPLDEMRKAFDAGATHLIYWKVDPAEKLYKAAASYVTPERLAALKKTRGDDRVQTRVGCLHARLCTCLRAWATRV